MAKRVVNNGIEFAYASENAENELKKELEKYFLYQNIFVVDARYECGELIDKLSKNVKCVISVVRNIKQITSFETVDAIIVVNNYDIENIKTFCYNFNIPYILVLTKICDASVSKQFVFSDKFQVQICNYPLGIIFDMQQHLSAKVMISQAIMEISSLSFDILQSKLENIFFDSNIDYEFASGQQKIIRALEVTIDERKEDIQTFLRRVIQLYLSYLLTTSKDKLNVIDELLCLYKRNCGTQNLIEIKSVFESVILSLEKNFLAYYTNKFLGTINYAVHQKYTKNYNFSANFGEKTIIFDKIDYILCDFRQKLLKYVNATIGFKNTIKNVLADIDIDNLYNINQKLKDIKFTDYICLEQDVFHSKNFLKILYELGLLNFEF